MCGRVLDLLKSHHPEWITSQEIQSVLGLTRHQTSWCLSVLKKNSGAVKDGDSWSWSGAEDVKFYLDRTKFEESGVLEALTECLTNKGDTFSGAELGAFLARPSTSVALLLRSLQREGIISNGGKANGAIKWRIHPEELKKALSRWQAENGKESALEPPPEPSPLPVATQENKPDLPEALVERTVTLSLTSDHGIHTECTAILGSNGKPQYVTYILKGSTIRTNRPGVRTQGGSFCSELLLRGVLTHKDRVPPGVCGGLPSHIITIVRRTFSDGHCSRCLANEGKPCLIRPQHYPTPAHPICRYFKLYPNIWRTTPMWWTRISRPRYGGRSSGSTPSMSPSE